MSDKTAQLLEVFAVPFDSGPLDDEETSQAADEMSTSLDQAENDAGSR
jgi:hypothetical protein